MSSNIFQDLAQEESHPRRLIEAIDFGGVICLQYSRTQEVVTPLRFAFLKEAREWLRDSGEFPRLHPSLPGRPRSGGNGDGQPKISARVPAEVAKWVQSKEPGWLGKLVQKEYDKQN